MTTAVAALLATWLVATAGSLVADPFGAIGDDGPLRALGAAFVLLATLVRGAGGQSAGAQLGGTGVTDAGDGEYAWESS